MGLGKYKSKEKRKESHIIVCEKVQGGFIFEVSVNQFHTGDKRVVVSAVDAITIFCALIHGQKLNEIIAHEEVKEMRSIVEAIKKKHNEEEGRDD